MLTASLECRQPHELIAILADRHIECTAARLVSSFDAKLYRRLSVHRSDENLVEQSLLFFLRGAAPGLDAEHLATRIAD